MAILITKLASDIDALYVDSMSTRDSKRSVLEAALGALPDIKGEIDAHSPEFLRVTDLLLQKRVSTLLSFYYELISTYAILKVNKPSQYLLIRQLHTFERILLVSSDSN